MFMVFSWFAASAAFGWWMQSLAAGLFAFFVIGILDNAIDHLQERK